MSLGRILSTIFLSPLQLLFEVVFHIANEALGSPGQAIFVLSLTVNLLLMPLYRQADALQDEERAAEKRLEKGVAHIKKAFRGDERMMILQAYYRENHYKPTYALRGAAPLLLELPFFMAAYRFLSGLTLLQGVGFGPIADLSLPDGLFLAGQFTVNVMPFLMTGVNLISCTIFTKGAPKKEKIQLYAMALFFLVFLYDSPSGLVLYWTLNNVFSLVKTILTKWKHSTSFLRIAAALAGAGMIVWGAAGWNGHSIWSLALPVGAGALLLLPLAVKLLRIPGGASAENVQPRSGVFFSEMLFLAVLIGMLIPSNVIQSSPQEFIFASASLHPNWYVASAFFIAFGMLVVWGGIFYFLGSPKARFAAEKIALAACCGAILDYMFFGTDMGVLTASLAYDMGLQFSRKEQLVNLALLLAVMIGVWLIFRRGAFKRHLSGILTVCTAAMVCMCIFNGIQINRSTVQLQENTQPENTTAPYFTISENGKNVVVIMLDRGMNAYIPYIFQENPELKTKFDGFLYYPNNISFGASTNIGTPSLFGGYEYTPAKINQRSEEWLVDKHDEALKVLPAIFGEEGYQVTVFDPPYAGYQQTPDLSIYDGMPNVSAYNTMGYFTEDGMARQMETALLRNLFCLGVMKAAPLSIQTLLYENGGYNRCGSVEDTYYAGQKSTGVHTAQGVELSFLESYDTLRNMRTMTTITQQEQNTCLIMANQTTHEVMLLQEPDYVPSAEVDNTAFDEKHADRFTMDGRSLRMDGYYDMASYQCNMAALLQLGAWFDYLRENGVYDNTRIILVADHGYDLGEVPELILKGKYDAQSFHALLMVKDFDSTGEVSTSDAFMTCADVPTLATDALIEAPVNPFTGTPITSEDKTAHDQYVHYSSKVNVSENNGKQYLYGTWYKVHDNIWDRENWTHLGNHEVYTEEK